VSSSRVVRLPAGAPPTPAGAPSTPAGVPPTAAGTPPTPAADPLHPAHHGSTRSTLRPQETRERAVAQWPLPHIRRHSSARACGPLGMLSSLRPARRPLEPAARSPSGLATSGRTRVVRLPHRAALESSGCLIGPRSSRPAAGLGCARVIRLRPCQPPPVTTVGVAVRPKEASRWRSRRRSSSRS
jgi:hypothetical protein